MRLYRAIPIGGKDFVYGWYVKGKTYSVIFPEDCHVYDFLSDSIEVIPETVGQQVGRQDKNSKDIYAGDILKNWIGNIVVGWSKKRLCWNAKELNTGTISMLSSYAITNDFEVIGNTTQHPELMENNK